MKSDLKYLISKLSELFHALDARNEDVLGVVYAKLPKVRKKFDEIKI